MENQPPPPDQRRERILLYAVGVGFALALGLALASAILMSLADDEAWILYGVQGLAERAEFAHRFGPGATTTGGLHSIVEMLLFRLAGNCVPVLRSFSIVCLVLMVREIFVWSRGAGFSAPAAWLAGTVLVAVPGTLTLAGSAYAAVPAALLTLAGIRRWDPLAAGASRRRWISAGLLGLAAATRIQCILVFPALAVASIPRERLRGSQWRSAGIALAFAGAIVVASYAGHVLLQVDSEKAVSVAGHAAGFGRSYALPFILRKWLSANQFLALPLLVGASFAAYWLVRVGFESRERLWGLVGSGWLIWSSWTVFAPIPHLRYLWPGLAAFSCVLGFALGQLYERGVRDDQLGLRAGALLIGIACLVTGSITTARNLVVGDLNTVAWEWRGIVDLGSAGSGHISEQAKMAEYLRGLPADARVASLDYPVELEFLSGRPIDRIQWYARGQRLAGQPLPGWILITPHLGPRWNLSRPAARFLQSQCQREVSFGRHILYRVTGEYPSNINGLASTRRLSGLPVYYE